MRTAEAAGFLVVHVSEPTVSHRVCIMGTYNQWMQYQLLHMTPRLAGFA